MKIAVFASGSGSNFQAIVESFQKQDIPGELACLFC
ncbi:MAG: phosphoribosylglycinamide formyltransferase, partial [Vagococcus sp.]